MRKNEPAPYSPTDTAEVEAINELEQLLDQKLVKTNLQKRDKYPNTDGYLELINERLIPIGKFEAQVRALPKNQKKYDQCPSSLVAYSTKSTLPIILFCVDKANKKAYWRHITPTMPEYKENQSTFTIHFNDDSDLIDEANHLYINKWIQIISDYQERIARYPIISKKLSNIFIDDISKQEKQKLQQLIDSINDLLDNDFVVVKELIFPDTWKLGIGLFEIDLKNVSFQLYRIHSGENSPLIQRFENGSLLSKNPNENAICDYRIRREELNNPITLGKEFVFKKFRNLVNQKELPIKSLQVSSDILFSFIDEYFLCLGMEPGLPSYSLEKISIGLNKNLYNICNQVISSINDSSFFIRLNLEWLKTYIQENNISSNQIIDKHFQFSIESKNVSIKSVFEAFDYLLANDISSINRKLYKNIEKNLSNNSLFPPTYSEIDEIDCVVNILNNSIIEYETFIHGNRINLQNCGYLDPKIAIVFEYYPVSIVNHAKNNFIHGKPMIRINFVDNLQNKLPKVITIIKNDVSNIFELEKFPSFTLIYENCEFNIINIIEDYASFLLGKSPTLNMIYRMLEKDLLLLESTF